MSSRPTDHANRDLAQFNLDVLRGNAKGQIIWQPRISGWYADMKFAQGRLPEPYEGLSRPELFRALGCSARLYAFRACFKEKPDPQVKAWTEPVGETDTRTVIETPVGRQESLHRRTPSSRRAIRLKEIISTPEEMRVAAWRAERQEWRFDRETYDVLMAEWGDLGAPTLYMPRANVQDLYVDTMSVEQAIYALYGWGDVVDAYFQALDASHMRFIDAVIASPIEVVAFGDNMHDQTMTPDLYQRYAQPAYLERSAKLRAAGRFVHAHWDGDVKMLLPFAQSSGLDGIEAITAKPQGDVTLEEAQEALGSGMFLLDGIPAVLFDEVYPEEQLIACVEKVIKLFAPKLVLGISDDFPASGNIERVRTVTRIVDAYNAALAGDE